MKNASQIINTLQCKPQFSKLITYRCVDKLKSSLLVSVQKNIKYGFVKNNTLYFILTTRLNKLDINNIINTIKLILNSPMILESEKFVECLGVKIEDVKIFTDPKPQKKYTAFTTTSHLKTYRERATGEMDVKIEDEKLKSLVQSVLEIIKERT